jgi:hypothetical protein
VFELGVNVEAFEFVEDGTTVTNWHRAFGSGIGTEIQRVDRFSGITAPYPLLQSVSTHSTVTRTATLAEHAEHALQRGAIPTTFVTLELRPDGLPNLGSYDVGDRVAVTADYGYIQLDRASYRIVAHTVNVNTRGETSVVTLAPTGVFA